MTKGVTDYVLRVDSYATSVHNKQKHSASMQLITSLTDYEISHQVRLKWELFLHRISHYPSEILFISSYDMGGMTENTVYNMPSSGA